MEFPLNQNLSILNEFDYFGTLDSKTILSSFNQSSPVFKNYDHLGQISCYVLVVSSNFPKTIKEESSDFEIDCLHQQIHPGDLEFYHSCVTKTNEFFNGLSFREFPLYKTRFDFRYSSDGFFKRFLQQRVVLECENETIKSFLVIMTDISDLKRSSSGHYSIVGINENESPDLNYATHIKVEDPFPFSRREKEVYGYLMQNLNSKGIALKLFVSIETIRNHRKRILKKTGCKNTLELIMTSHENGWI